MNCSFLHRLLSKPLLTNPDIPLTSASVHDTTSTIDSAGTKVILVNTVIEVFLYEHFFLRIIYPYTAVEWLRKLMLVVDFL